MGKGKLRPCPFCGGYKIRVINIHLTYEPPYQWERAKCDKCCAHGPVAVTKEVAAEYWNRRKEVKDEKRN